MPPVYMGQSLSTLVVVDDDPEIVDVLCDFFGMIGIATSSCPPGPQVPSYIAQQQASVVILDVQLDGMNGVDIFRHLQADPATRALPIIFFTGSEDSLRKLLPDYQARGAALVLKPNIHKLRTVVESMLDQAA